MAEAPTGARRRLVVVLGPLALILGSLLGLALAGEIVLRSIVWAKSGPKTLDGQQLETFTSLQQIVRANVHGIYHEVVHRTNSRGLRGPEYTPRPSPGTFRIGITGDSVTMGSGVREEDVYSVRLERLMNADGTGPPVEVLNMGMAGINTRVAIERLRLMAGHYKPHLFVYGFTLNDIEGKAYRKLDANDADVSEFWYTASERARSNSYLVRVLWAQLVNLQVVLNRSLIAYVDELRVNYLENPEAWSEVVRGLEAYAALAREHGVCGHVLIHTHLGQLGADHPYHEVYALVEATARGLGLSVTQSLPGFQGKEAPDLWVSYVDSHPNAEAHRILAHQLYEGLMALPAECWELDRSATLDGA